MSIVFARFPSLLRAVAIVLALTAAQPMTLSLAAETDPNQAARWFLALIESYDKKSFCIPAHSNLLDVARTLQQYTHEHQATDKVTTPQAVQIMAQLYPCPNSATVGNAIAPPANDNDLAPRTHELAPFDMRQAVALMRVLRETRGHENDAVLDKIRERADTLSPPVFFALANLLYRRGDVDEAIFWLNAARVRGSYDALRSANAANGRAVIAAMVQQIPVELRKAQFKDLPKLREAVTKAIAWDETTPHNYDRRWIEFNGANLTAGSPATGVQSAAPVAVPEEKWPELAKEVRDDYRRNLEKSIAQMGSGQN